MGKLISDKERENFMKQWDYWRKRIVEGDASSGSRDWFEGLLDYLEGEYQYLQNNRISIKTSDLLKWQPGTIIGRRGGDR